MYRNKGFTLIEILVVMSIIGILSSIGTYGIMKSREKSKVTKSKADISTLSVGITRMYSDVRLYPGLLPRLPITAIPPVTLSVNLTDAKGNDLSVAGLESITGCSCSSATYYDVISNQVDKNLVYTGCVNGMNTGATYNRAACYSSKWAGPYVVSIPLDPWGKPYRFDYSVQNGNVEDMIKADK